MRSLAQVLRGRRPCPFCDAAEECEHSNTATKDRYHLGAQEMVPAPRNIVRPNGQIAYYRGEPMPVTYLRQLDAEAAGDKAPEPTNANRRGRRTRHHPAPEETR